MSDHSEAYRARARQLGHRSLFDCHHNNARYAQPCDRCDGTCEVWPLRRVVVYGCPTCTTHGQGIMPPHDASTRCESGGHKHCTCGTCF